LTTKKKQGDSGCWKQGKVGLPRKKLPEEKGMELKGGRSQKRINCRKEISNNTIEGDPRRKKGVKTKGWGLQRKFRAGRKNTESYKNAGPKKTFETPINNEKRVGVLGKKQGCDDYIKKIEGGGGGFSPPKPIKKRCQEGGKKKPERYFMTRDSGGKKKKKVELFAGLLCSAGGGEKGNR